MLPPLTASTAASALAIAASSAARLGGVALLVAVGLALPGHAGGGLAGLRVPALRVAGLRVPALRVPAAAYGFDQIHPAWLQGTYWAGRPWPTGWYRATPARWSLPGVAPGREIVAAVNGALAQGVVAIPVPATNRWLNVASVEALANGRITFVHSDGGPSQRAVGDCQLGVLDGRPVREQGVHLLHAACVVAYGWPN